MAALRETIQDVKHMILIPLCICWVRRQEQVFNTWADAQVQALLLLGYQPSWFSNRHPSKWAATEKTLPKPTDSTEDKRKVQDRWKWEAPGKFPAIFIAFDLSQFTSFPSFHGLVYQADMEVAVCILNQLGPVKRKASRAWVSLKSRE